MKNKIRSKHKVSLKSKSSRFLSLRLQDSKDIQHHKKKSFIEINDELDPALLLKYSSDRSEQATLSTKQNDDPFPSLEKVEKADTYERCILKQGYLAQIFEGVDDSPVPHLHARPIFAQLTREKLIFYQNQDVNSIIKVMRAKDLGYALSPKTWDVVNCFQIMRTPKDGDDRSIDQFVENLDLTPDKTSFEVQIPASDNILLNLCADSQDHINKWLTALSDFQQCQDPVEEAKSSTFTNRDIDVAMQQLDDDQQENRDQNEQSGLQKESAAKKKIDDQISSMRENLKAQELRQAQLQKAADLKLEKEKRKTDQLLQQKECLAKILTIQEEEQFNQEKDLENEETNVINQNKITDSQDQISNEFTGLDNQIEKENQKLIDAEKQRQKDIQDSMAKQVIAMEKQPSADIPCMNEKLKTDTETQIRETCSSFIQKDKIPDPFEYTRCLRKDKFCDVCCENEIGDMYTKKKMECSTTCNDILNPPPPPIPDFVLQYQGATPDNAAKNL